MSWTGFVVGQRVKIVSGINQGIVVTITKPRDPHGWYELSNDTMAFEDNLILYLGAGKDDFSIPQGNIIEMPTPKPVFAHKHQLRFKDNFLELTHKELKELKLIIEGLTNG